MTSAETRAYAEGPPGSRPWDLDPPSLIDGVSTPGLNGWEAASAQELLQGPGSLE